MTMSNRVHNECFLITDESLGDGLSKHKKGHQHKIRIKKKKKSNELDGK